MGIFVQRLARGGPDPVYQHGGAWIGAVLCGHSLGGTVALEVAALDPRLVAGVALLDPVILFPEPVRRQALERLVPALAGSAWLEALRGYVADRMFGSLRST